MRISDWSSDVCSSDLGNVTPSSSKSPVSCTSPLVICTCATMVLLICVCQIRTTQTPFCEMRAASIRPLLIATDPTAAVRLHQFPAHLTQALGTEELRVGKECVSACRLRCESFHQKKT